MPRMPHELHVDAELAQVSWVRRLALAVARDASDADDLAQDAWVAALMRKPDASEPLGGWFRRVLLNLARLRRRADARRGTRERVAARPEHDASEPPVALERLETQESLLRAVRELDEPFRNAIVLRWFEGLEPAEIASRTGAPLRTVQARLARGIALLRERLDRDARRDGDRARWLSAWVPLLTRTDTPWPWILIMDAKLKVALASAAAIGALTAVWLTVPEREERASAALAHGDEPRIELDPGAPALAPMSSEGRAHVASAPEAAPSVPAAVAAEPAAEIEGLVLDATGAPVAGVGVDYAAQLASGGEPRATSDARGAFRLAAPKAQDHLRTRSEAWTDVLTARVDPDRLAGPHTLVVAPRIVLEGVVVDEHATPIAGAKVELEVGDVRGRLQVVLDRSSLGSWSAGCDGAGRFRMDDVPALASAQLRASAMGFAPALVDAGEQARFDVRIVLRPVEESRLRGAVVDAEGAPVAGAYVALGSSSTRSDAGGRFELEFDSPYDAPSETTSSTRRGDPRHLRAVKSGFLPAEIPCAADDVRAAGAWPDPLVLRLSSPSLSIRGYVVDADGEPVEHAAVWLLDRTEFTWVSMQIGAADVTLNADVETLLADERFPVDVHTRADGGFELRGLLARSYRLRVLDRRTLRALVTEPIAAGSSDVEIRLPAVERIPRIAGRVLDRRGNAVEGARVTVQLGQLTPKLEDVGSLASDAVTSDAEGRFELRELSRAAERLVVLPQGSLHGRSLKLAEIADLEDVEVRIAGSCHLQVELAGSGIDARAFRVLDAQGEPLQLAAHQGDISYAMTMVGLTEGRSQALMVSDAATTLVLLRDEVEVERIPLDLRTGELNVVRP
jgi:RNA polymerase sigma factor (sigma-70 family)